MTETALAAFAQIIPVLFIAAFLSNVRIGADAISRWFAVAFMAFGAAAEILCLIYLMLGRDPGTSISAAIVAATIYMLISVLATTWQKLQDDQMLDKNDSRQEHDHNHRDA